MENEKNIICKTAAKLLKPDEVSAILGVSKSFTYNLIRRGELNSVCIGHAVRVREQDLRVFIEAHLKNQNPTFCYKNMEVKNVSSIK